MASFQFERCKLFTDSGLKIQDIPNKVIKYPQKVKTYVFSTIISLIFVLELILDILAVRVFFRFYINKFLLIYKT